MRRRALMTFFCMALLWGTLFMPTTQGNAATSVNFNPSVQDVGVQLRSEELSEVKLDTTLYEQVTGDEDAASDSSGSDGTASAQYDVGETKWMVALDNYNGSYYLKSFTLRGVGQYGEVWVANDLSFPEGDPRNDRVNITQEHIDYLLSEFDKNMYPKEVEFFGEPDVHTGENALLEQWGIESYRDEAGRVMILIDNIRDESYYDPSYPSYIAGFYSPTIEIYTDRNVMTIDAYDWANRTGPDAERPYLYEGVFAHEFQHLLHDDYDSDEESWINEGMSDYAQYLVGYGHSTSHVDFFLNHLENSLTAWEDQGGREVLADYGFAYLFQLYLYDHFGSEFIRDLFHETENGIAGVETIMNKHGIDKDFKQLFQEFVTAILIDGKYLGDDSTYQFDSIDLNPNLDTEQAYDTPGAPAWGTDFIKITSDVKVDRLYMNGIDFFKTPWKAVDDPMGERGTVLWGNNGNLIDNHLITEIDLTGLDAVTDTATLSFDTYYEIELDWDYGFVQVSTDNGETWTSLSNENTSTSLDPNGHPNIKANLPGFTGSSGGWTTEHFDLSDYIGQKVLVSFRYMTDWAYNEAGWYIDNIRVDAVDYHDPADSTDGFMSLQEVLGEYTDYLVSFVGVKKGTADKYKVVHVNDVLNFTEEEAQEIEEMFNDASYDYVVMMVTHAGKNGNNSYADYSYEVVEHQTGPKK